jgi:signal transduction histidine kinase
MAKKIVAARQLSGNKEAQRVEILSSSIAHELNNYLATISICAELSEKNLGDIRKKVTEAAHLIGFLQMQIKGVVTGKPSKAGFKMCSIAEDITEAFEQYPFKEGGRELITIEPVEDFKYEGSRSLTVHVLYNLIRNALHAIANEDKGIIIIKTERGKKYNKLIFRDTASGISKAFLPKVFKLFESQKLDHGGSGIGLAYCKEIMQSYGGDITCDSVEGKYTEFALSFPFLKKQTGK